MKETVHLSRFIDAFTSLRPKNFTIDALRLMYDSFLDFERETGTEMQLDVIAICCEFDQFTLKEINSQYHEKFESLDEAIEWLNDQTFVLCSDNDWVVFQQF